MRKGRHMSRPLSFKESSFLAKLAGLQKFNCRITEPLTWIQCFWRATHSWYCHESKFLMLQMERWCGSPGVLPWPQRPQRGVLLANSPLLLHPFRSLECCSFRKIHPEATVSPDSSHPVMEQDGGTRAGPLLPDMGFLWSIVCALGLPVRLAPMCLRFFSSHPPSFPLYSQESDLHLSLPTIPAPSFILHTDFPPIHLLHISFCLRICFSEDQNWSR